MTKSSSIFETKKIIGVIICLFIYFLSNAQSGATSTKNISGDLSKHGYIGVIIVLGILLLSVVAFFVTNFIERHRKTDGKTPSNPNHYSHKKHHHHKIIKKSA